MNNEKGEIEIPFGAIDSELNEFEYTIPEGAEAEIRDGKVIIKKSESEDEKIRKELIKLVCTTSYLHFKLREEMLDWLEKRGEQKPVEWSKEDELYYDQLKLFLKVKEREAIDVDYKHRVHKILNWFESFHPKKQWKPSEEQLKVLYNVVTYRISCLDKSSDDTYSIMKSLYEELKAL